MPTPSSKRWSAPLRNEGCRGWRNEIFDQIKSYLVEKAGMRSTRKVFLETRSALKLLGNNPGSATPARTSRTPLKKRLIANVQVDRVENSPNRRKRRLNCAGGQATGKRWPIPRLFSSRFTGRQAHPNRRHKTIVCRTGRDRLKSVLRVLPDSFSLPLIAGRPVKFWAVYSYLIVYDPETNPCRSFACSTEYATLKRF